MRRPCSPSSRVGDDDRAGARARGARTTGAGRDGLRPRRGRRRRRVARRSRASRRSTPSRSPRRRRAYPTASTSSSAQGGRLVVPIGSRADQRLVLVVRSPEGPAEVRSLPCRYVPLLGAEGFQSQGRAPAGSALRLRSVSCMEPATSETQRASRGRVNDALRKRQNWEQLLKFCVVGASGYAVNLAVYTLLVKGRTSTTSRRPSARSPSPSRTTTRGIVSGRSAASAGMSPTRGCGSSSSRSSPSPGKPGRTGIGSKCGRASRQKGRAVDQAGASGGLPQQGGAGGAKKRRVVIDSQAARRDQMSGPPPQRPPRPRRPPSPPDAGAAAGPKRPRSTPRRPRSRPAPPCARSPSCSAWQRPR